MTRARRPPRTLAVCMLRMLLSADEGWAGCGTGVSPVRPRAGCPCHTTRAGCPCYNGATPLCLCVAVLALAGGCAGPLKPIFEPPDPPIVWPAAPARPRIRYVGELRSEADLKPPPKPFQALGELLVGRNAPKSMYGPRDVVVSEDASMVWVADPGGRCLHGLDLEKRVYTKVEWLQEARLLTPVGLCPGPAGSIYLCDSESPAIYRLHDRSGVLLETLRITEDLMRPVAMYYDATVEELFVVDAVAHDLKVLDRAGRLLRTLGQRGEGPGEFNFPCGIAGDGEIIWIVDAGNHRVQGLTRSGDAVSVFGQAGDAMGDLALPKGIALDREGHLYVVDARFETIQIFDRQGRLLLFFGQEGTGPGEFWLPSGIFIDTNDWIWVCDGYNGRVQVFEYLPDTDLPGTTGTGANEPAHAEPTAGPAAGEP